MKTYLFENIQHKHHCHSNLLALLEMSLQQSQYVIYGVNIMCLSNATKVFDKSKNCILVYLEVKKKMKEIEIKQNQVEYEKTGHKKGCL